MQIEQLKSIIISFAEFAQSVSRVQGTELHSLAATLPGKSVETTASFIKRVKRNLERGGIDAPSPLTEQLDGIQKLAASLGAKKGIVDDIALLRSLFTFSPSVDLETSLNQLKAARDYVPTPVSRSAKKTSTSGKNKSSPSVKQITTAYIEKLVKTALSPAEFEAVYRELETNASLQEKNIKEIANKLNNFPSKSPKRPKSREEAFQRILDYQHKKAGSESAKKALELTPL